MLKTELTYGYRNTEQKIRKVRFSPLVVMPVCLTLLEIPQIHFNLDKQSSLISSLAKQVGVTFTILRVPGALAMQVMTSWHFLRRCYQYTQRSPGSSKWEDLLKITSRWRVTCFLPR